MDSGGFFCVDERVCDIESSYVLGYDKGVVIRERGSERDEYDDVV